MKVYHKAAEITAEIRALKTSGKSIGFVPTMGALHKGHLSLVAKCNEQNDITVVSIFVNPTQFNDKNDLKHYPRMPEKDLPMLESEGCDMVFLPDEKEIYPEPDNRKFDFGHLDRVMEGSHRPGHFNGVTQVVTRLFDIILPQRAYFGLKDFQQVAIIKYVVKNLSYNLEIIACPIVRENDGLAMSSRNMLLNPTERKNALVLSQTLFKAYCLKESRNPDEVKEFVTETIRLAPGIELEYFEIVEGSTLLNVHSWRKDDDIIGCIAARVGKIRLIDNINFSS